MKTDISAVPIESWSVERVLPYPFNHKTHPEKHIDLLTRSIKTQGLLDPIVLDREGVIISGHGRFAAIKRLGWVKVSVRVLRDVTDEEASALRIAANKTVSNDFDTDMLSRELQMLSESEVPMDLTALGFDERELSMLLTDVGVIDTDTLVGDMNEAIEAHEEHTEETASHTDEQDVRLDKVFGFKTVTIRDQKTITRFMAEIEATTSKTGSEALVTFMHDYLKAA